MERNFEFWTNEWLKSYEVEVKANTYSEYKRIVKQLIQHFGNMTLEEISPKIIQDFLNELYYNGKAKSTINKRLHMIQQIYRFANIHGTAVSNPCSFAKTPKLAPTAVRRALTDKEQQVVMFNRDKSIYGFYAFCLLMTGLRRSEMLALRWEDIDFTQKIIHVHRVVTYSEGTVHIDNVLKNGNSERDLPITDLLYAELINNKKKSGFLFGGVGNSPIRENRHNWNWELYLRNTGLCVTQHMFRHTFATMLFKAEIDIKTAAYLLGHNDEHTTLAIYTHLQREEAARKAIIKLNGIINVG